jgi:hypothetical protein
MGPYSGVEYYLTLCSFQSRLQHIYYWQPYASVVLNHMSESTLSLCKGLWIWPLDAEDIAGWGGGGGSSGGDGKGE